MGGTYTKQIEQLRVTIYMIYMEQFKWVEFAKLNSDMFFSKCLHFQTF